MMLEVTTKTEKFVVKFNSPSEEYLKSIEDPDEESQLTPTDVYIKHMLNALSRGLNNGCSYKVIEC